MSTHPSPEETLSPPRARRGFAAMDPQRLREIARAGGRAAHEKGSAHRFDAQEARLAGLKSRALAAAAAAAAADLARTADGAEPTEHAAG